MNKRGQITIFIIIGILIIISVTLLLFYSKGKLIPDGKEQAETNQIMDPLKSQIDHCLEESLKETILFVGMQGGYYYSPAKTEEFLQADIPYYYYENEEISPDKKEMERQLALGVKEKLPKCLNKIKQFFNNTGVVMEYNIKTISILIANDKVVLNSKMPTKVYYGADEETDIISNKELARISNDFNSISELEDFSIELNVKYKNIIDWSKQIVQLQAKYPQEFPLSQVMDLAYDNGFKVEIISPEEVGTGERENSDEDKKFEVVKIDQNNKVIISILDEEMFDKPYYFSFGILYDIDIKDHFKEDIALEQEYKEMTAKG
jgi:hypothetical protein